MVWLRWLAIADRWSMSPGEMRRVGYFFMGGQEAVNYLSSAEKFYIWEGRIVGEARIVNSENSN